MTERQGVMWVDKYRPTSLDKMEVHRDLNERLSAIGAQGDVPHLLFYGPSGAGKKTRVVALLRLLFGSAVLKVSFIQHHPINARRCLMY